MSCGALSFLDHAPSPHTSPRDIDLVCLNTTTLKELLFHIHHYGRECGQAPVSSAMPPDPFHLPSSSQSMSNPKIDSAVPPSALLQENSYATITPPSSSSWLAKAEAHIVALVMGAFALLMTACTSSSFGFVEKPEIPNDIVATDELYSLLKKKPNVAIALRMKLPAARRVIKASWQRDSKRGFAGFSSAGAFGVVSKTEMSKEAKIFEIMEKELVRAGFTVRDRTLLEKLLAGKEFVDTFKLAGFYR
jgi:hypothetical protein